MEKRSILFIILFITIVVTIVFVTMLTIKNNNLKFLCDENKQLVLVEKIYNDIIPNINSGNININVDVSNYRNFVTYENYNVNIIDQIDSIFNNYSTEEKSKDYTIKLSFDVKKLQLNILVENVNSLDSHSYSYKLGIDKSEDAITYELIEPIIHSIE